jgi:hypothetical protein
MRHNISDRFYVGTTISLAFEDKPITFNQLIGKRDKFSQLQRPGSSSIRPAAHDLNLVNVGTVHPMLLRF